MEFGLETFYPLPSKKEDKTSFYFSRWWYSQTESVWKGNSRLVQSLQKLCKLQVLYLKTWMYTQLIELYSKICTKLIDYKLFKMQDLSVLTVISLFLQKCLNLIYIASIREKHLRVIFLSLRKYWKLLYLITNWRA